VVLVEGRLENLVGLDEQAAEDLFVRARDAFRGCLQPLAIGVLADRDEQLTDGRGRPVEVDLPLRVAQACPPDEGGAGG
jgi:hypothetical protein